MSSTFSWLDTAERDRQHALDVIDLFRLQSTVDDLGIGTVRDALADLLFPGTSTIQTRARYFLFIPWLYRRLEDHAGATTDIARHARAEEIKLIDALAASTDTAGVIGIESRARLQRLPSAVYWAGLGRWGIRLFPGTQDLYHRSFSRIADSRRAAARAAAEDPEAAVSAAPSWHPHLPPAPAGFPDQAAFALTRDEALYLQDRIITRAPRTLLALLAEQPARWALVAFPWLHPVTADLPPRLRDQVEHARLFSIAIHGSALVYNLMLAQADQRDDTAAEYAGWVATWAAEEVAPSIATLRAWDRAAFWRLVLAQNPRIPSRTSAFIDAWCDNLLAAADLRTLHDLPAVRRLITDREREAKGNRARLQSREHLALWSGAAGTAQLDYRWNKVQTILDDILRGLAASADDARAA